MVLLPSNQRPLKVENPPLANGSFITNGEIDRWWQLGAIHALQPAFFLPLEFEVTSRYKTPTQLQISTWSATWYQTRVLTGEMILIWLHVRNILGARTFSDFFISTIAPLNRMQNWINSSFDRANVNSTHHHFSIFFPTCRVRVSRF